ncbi:hypothetical protein [Paraburkholderia xenovorans]|uniref:hypothetical protein n=1 Tax=Paraburkholderia xenovorans TaxID=36873 RepID=UPI0038BA0E68
MKSVNDLGLIILISIGVICVIYWIKLIPTAASEDAPKNAGCQMAIWSIGTPGTEEEKAARNRAANEACKSYFNTAGTKR